MGRASKGRATTAAAPTVILVRPQLGENIGMAARAILNCGVSSLRLVAPRDGWPNPKAQRAASGADVVLVPATGLSGGTILKNKGFYPGAFVGTHYELLRDLGENNSGWAFYAEDLRDEFGVNASALHLGKNEQFRERLRDYFSLTKAKDKNKAREELQKPTVTSA